MRRKDMNRRQVLSDEELNLSLGRESASDPGTKHAAG